MSDHKTNQAMLPPDHFAPPAEAKGEISREELEGMLWLLSDEKGRDGTGAREVRTILAAFDSLRTRARAAEYKAEARQANIVDTNRTLERVIREAEEARRMIAGVQPDDRAALAVNILRAWPRAEIETFARHLLGDREQESLLLGQLQTQLEIVTRERDEAREQRDDLTEQIGRGQRLLSDTLRERDAAIGQVAEACRERDLFERERDEARELLAKERGERGRAESMILGKDATSRADLAVNLLRYWPKEDIRRHALYWLGEGWVPDMPGLLAAANARAEEAERRALMAGQDKVAAQRRADSSHRLMENERAARLKAEKEMNLLIGRDVPRLEERLAAAEAEVKRLRECHRTAAETVWDVAVARKGDTDEAAALRASAQRLMEAGDEVRDILCAILDQQYTYSERTAAVDRWVVRWAAAKEQK